MKDKSADRHVDCTFTRHMRSGQYGMTLIELMVVVAIIAILVSVAVPLLTRTTRKAQSAEVPAMFAELKLRQDQYYAELGEYLSTGASETDTHPAAPSSPDQPTAIAPVPATWTDLRMQPDKNALYCAYVALAGDAGVTPAGAEAVSFGFGTAPGTNPPQTDWYYLLAYCDLDGDPAVNSVYFTSSMLDKIATRDPGR